MFRGAVWLACACACACAVAPAQPLETPTPLARPRPAPVVAATPACVHDADATDVSYLRGDARTIEVCFAPSACFAIDRRTHTIAKSSVSVPKPGAPPHRTQPLSLAWVNKDVARICAGADCVSIEDVRAGLVDGGRVDFDDGEALITVGGDGTAATHVFRVDTTLHKLVYVPITVVAPCAEATWLDDHILVTSDDCNGGAPIGMLYDRRGHSLFQVGLGHAIDTHDATSRHQDNTLAIVAPRAYSLVLVDSPSRQSVIDLVPIQAESTPTPRFDVAALGDSDWVVASATGGVGIVDHRTTSLAKTWIIPRCEASP